MFISLGLCGVWRYVLLSEHCPKADCLAGRDRS